MPDRKESGFAKLAGAPSNDYLPDVEVDAETKLNAWRWKHATFFNRIHEKVSREWHAGDVLSKDRLIEIASPPQ